MDVYSVDMKVVWTAVEWGDEMAVTLDDGAAVYLVGELADLLVEEKESSRERKMAEMMVAW